MIPTEPVLLPIVEAGRQVGDMPFRLSEQCATCSRLRDNLACEAYPGRIPEAIRTGAHDHTKPFPGDNGLLYQPIPETDP